MISLFKRLSNSRFSYDCAKAKRRIKFLRNEINALKMERDDINESIYADEAEIAQLSHKLSTCYENIRDGQSADGKRYVGKYL